jgi:hypothetical protein
MAASLPDELIDQAKEQQNTFQEKANFCFWSIIRTYTGNK